MTFRLEIFLEMTREVLFHEVHFPSQIFSYTALQHRSLHQVSSHQEKEMKN